MLNHNLFCHIWTVVLFCKFLAQSLQKYQINITEHDQIKWNSQAKALATPIKGNTILLTFMKIINSSLETSWQQQIHFLRDSASPTEINEFWCTFFSTFKEHLVFAKAKLSENCTCQLVHIHSHMHTPYSFTWSNWKCKKDWVINYLRKQLWTTQSIKNLTFLLSKGIKIHQLLFICILLMERINK